MEDKEQLFARVVSESKDSIYRICYSFVNQKADVEDLKQEIYMSIWDAIDRFEGNSSWNTYIYRIAINTAIQYTTLLKSGNKDYYAEFAELTEIQSESGSDNKEKKLRRMRKCIQQLSNEDRTVITLVLENLSYKEIAEVLDISINHVGVKVSRAKSRLMKKIKEQYGKLQ